MSTKFSLPQEKWTLDIAYEYATNRALVASADGEEPLYNCPFTSCKKQFSKRFNLKAHLRVHTGDKPFCCKYPGCSRRFMWKSSLTSHEMGHKRRNIEAQKRIDAVAKAAAAAAAAGLTVDRTGPWGIRQPGHTIPPNMQAHLDFAGQRLLGTPSMMNGRPPQPIPIQPQVPQGMPAHYMQSQAEQRDMVHQGQHQMVHQPPQPPQVSQPPQPPQVTSQQIQYAPQQPHLLQQQQEQQASLQQQLPHTTQQTPQMPQQPPHVMQSQSQMMQQPQQATPQQSIQMQHHHTAAPYVAQQRATSQQPQPPLAQQVPSQLPSTTVVMPPPPPPPSTLPQNSHTIAHHQPNLQKDQIMQQEVPMQVHQNRGHPQNAIPGQRSLNESDETRRAAGALAYLRHRDNQQQQQQPRDANAQHAQSPYEEQRQQHLRETSQSVHPPRPSRSPSSSKQAVSDQRQQQQEVPQREEHRQLIEHRRVVQEEQGMRDQSMRAPQKQPAMNDNTSEQREQKSEQSQDVEMEEERPSPPSANSLKERRQYYTDYSRVPTSGSSSGSRERQSPLPSPTQIRESLYPHSDFGNSRLSPPLPPVSSLISPRAFPLPPPSALSPGLLGSAGGGFGTRYTFQNSASPVGTPFGSDTILPPLTNIDKASSSSPSSGHSIHDVPMPIEPDVHTLKRRPPIHRRSRFSRPAVALPSVGRGPTLPPLTAPTAPAGKVKAATPPSQIDLLGCNMMEEESENRPPSGRSASGESPLPLGISPMVLTPLQTGVQSSPMVSFSPFGRSSSGSIRPRQSTPW